METLNLQETSNLKIRKLPFKPSRIYVRNSEAIYSLNKSDITYLKARGNYTEIYLSSGKKILSSKTLKYFDNLIADSQFLRPHQSFLINLHFLRELRVKDKTILLENGEIIPVSRSRFPLISSKLKN